MAHCLSVKLMYAAHCDWSKYHRLSALHYNNNVTAEIALGLWLQNCLYIVIYTCATSCAVNTGCTASLIPKSLYLVWE